MPLGTYLLSSRINNSTEGLGTRSRRGWTQMQTLNVKLRGMHKQIRSHSPQVRKEFFLFSRWEPLVCRKSRVPTLPPRWRCIAPMSLRYINASYFGWTTLFHIHERHVAQWSAITMKRKETVHMPYPDSSTGYRNCSDPHRKEAIGVEQKYFKKDKDSCEHIFIWRLQRNQFGWCHLGDVHSSGRFNAKSNIFSIKSDSTPSAQLLNATIVSAIVG